MLSFDQLHWVHLPYFCHISAERGIVICYSTVYLQMTADPGGVYLQNRQFTLSINISFPILLTVHTFFSPLLTGLLDNSNNEVN